MTCKPLVITALVSLTTTSMASADSTENKAFLLEALGATLLSGNINAVEQYFAPDYIQHNPNFANGVEAQKGLVRFLSGAEGFAAEYLRVIADDDMVAIHGRYAGFGPVATIGFDLFRSEDGLIVELWDVIEPMPGPDAPHNEAGKF